MIRFILILAMASWAASVDPPSAPPQGEAAERGASEREAAKGPRYRPVQLHLHGSMSEGDGTMHGHNFVAEKLGTVDVLWWTDHDWRIAGHGHLEGFSFEKRREFYPVPYRDMPPTRHLKEAWVEIQEEKAGRGIAEMWARLIPEAAFRGRHGLRIVARAEKDEKRWRWAGVAVVAGGGRLKAPLAADVELEVLVRPLTPWSEDRQLVIRLELSRQVDGITELRYVLGDPGERRIEHTASRKIGVIPVEAPLREWSGIYMNVTLDAQELGLGGWDNSLRRITLGMQVRRGAMARIDLDDLLRRRGKNGKEVLARAEEMAAALGHDFGRANHVGLEVSYAHHMNAFLPQIEMPDFERHPHGMSPRQTVEWVHERGGVVSYNHVYGTGAAAEDEKDGDYAERAAFLVENRGFGADLLEVGYPHRVLPLTRHLEIWDELSRRQVLIGGIGTSDSHSQMDGWTEGNNHVTWVWSASSRREDLIAGLRARRAFFGDPMLFKGTIELTTPDGAVMGEKIEVGKGPQEIVLSIKDLPEGATVRFIDTGKVRKSLRPPAGDFRRTFRVKTRDYRFVRAEVWLGERGIAFSNCLYFVHGLSKRTTPREWPGSEL